MESINRIELQGVVGNSRITQVGTSTVARFSMATNEVFSNSGHIREETTWHSVTAWSGKGVPDLTKIVKGTHVHVVGRLRQSRYVAHGEDRIFYEVIASRITIIK